MSVLIETSLGSFVIDLYTEEAPHTTTNFLKLCKIGYYNNVLFYNVQKDYIVQTGDPTGTGRGGRSIFNQLYGNETVHFDDEIVPTLRHNQKGIVSMANTGPNTNTSQFFITVNDKCPSFDDHNTVFGYVAEGYDTVQLINQAYCDEEGRPYGDIRILRTVRFIDPFPDPPLLLPLIQQYKQQLLTQGTLERPLEERVPKRLNIEETENIIQTNQSLLTTEGSSSIVKKTAEELQQIKEQLAEDEARSRAVVLEMVGDLPSADVAPPDDTLFICKLNPITTGEDIELIFSRYGECKVDILRDPKTGASLCYGFVEYKARDACELAYNKMNGVLIDDRRIKIDFSQSVARLWNKYKFQRNKLVDEGHTGGGLVPGNDNKGTAGEEVSRSSTKPPYVPNRNSNVSSNTGNYNNNRGTGGGVGSNNSNVIDMASILSAVKARAAIVLQNFPSSTASVPPVEIPTNNNTGGLKNPTQNENNNVSSSSSSVVLTTAVPVVVPSLTTTNPLPIPSTTDNRSSLAKDEPSRHSNGEERSKHKKHHHHHRSHHHRQRSKSPSRSRSPTDKHHRHHHRHHRSGSRSRSTHRSHHRSDDDRSHRSSHHHHRHREREK